MKIILKKLFLKWVYLLCICLQSMTFLFKDYSNRNNIQSFYSKQDSSVRDGNQVYDMLYFKQLKRIETLVI